jgi:hypothetical protein
MKPLAVMNAPYKHVANEVSFSCTYFVQLRRRYAIVTQLVNTVVSLAWSWKLRYRFHKVPIMVPMNPACIPTVCFSKVLILWCSVYVTLFLHQFCGNIYVSGFCLFETVPCGVTWLIVLTEHSWELGSKEERIKKDEGNEERGWGMNILKKKNSLLSGTAMAQSV